MKLLDLVSVVRSTVRSSERRVWRVKKKSKFIPWCEDNIVISTAENKDFAGGYKRKTVLVTARLWEEFLDNEVESGTAWRELIVQKGSQSAMTSHALMAITKAMEEDPGNVIYVIHSDKEADNISDRLDGFVEGCAGAQRLVDEVENSGKKGKGIKTLKKSLPGMTIWLTGAGSAGNLASKSGVIWVIVDEVNKHPNLKGETSSIELLRDRMKAVASGRLVAFSTPTDENGQISKEVTTGSEHRYHVPCPHCDEMQWLKPGRLRYDHCKDLAGEYDLERVLRETRFQCSGCGKEIDESHKTSMLDAGEWRPTNYRKSINEAGDEVEVPNWVPGRMTAYMNDLAALWEHSSWGHIAVQAITAKGDRIKQAALKNGRYGEVFVRGGVPAVSEKDVRKLMGAYKRGTLPQDPTRGVFFVADTQGDCWKWMIGGFNAQKDLMLSDWGVAIAWKDLLYRAHQGIEYPAGSGRKIMAKFCLVDEGGDRTREVRQKLVGMNPWFNGCKGLGGIQVRTTLEWKMFDVDKEGTRQVRVLTYDDDGFKRELYKDMIYKAARAGSKDKDAAELGSRRCYFPADLDDEVIKEICSERVGTDGKWAKHGANDYGDDMKYLLISHAAVGHVF